MEKIAVIIRGPSAVGKSTIANLLHKKLPNSACIDIDILKRMLSEESTPIRTQIAHAVALSFADQLIEHKYNIILEEIFRDEHLTKFYNILTTAGYRVMSIFLEAELPTLVARDEKRAHKVKGETVVSRLHEEIVPRKDDIVINTEAFNNEEIVEKIFKIANQ